MEEDPKTLIPDSDLEFITKWTSESNLETLRSHLLKLWQTCKEKYHTYVCIERFMFLKPRLPYHVAYKSLLEKLKSPDSKQIPKKVIDVGCCFGQDIRQLILEGVETKNIYAVDIHDGYWNVGREFYMDNLSHLSTRLDGITTLFEDFAKPYPLPAECTDRVVDSLTGNFEAVVCQLVFHVLTKEQTENLIKRMCSMLKKGGILIGTCLGSKEDATSWAKTPTGEGVRYLQSLKSLNELLGENGFINIDVKEIETNQEGKKWKSQNVPQMPEGHADVKKCRLEFVAYKK